MKREMLIAVLVASVTVLAVYVWLGVLPLARRLHQQQLAYTRVKKAWAATQDLLARQEEYRDRALRIRIEAKRLEDRLPPQPGMPRLLRDVTRVAAECELKDFQFKPLPLTAKAGFAEQPVEVSFVCRYHDLGLFVSKLAELPRLTSVRQIALEGRDQTGRHESVAAHMTLVTYVHDPR